MKGFFKYLYARNYSSQCDRFTQGTLNGHSNLESIQHNWTREEYKIVNSQKEIYCLRTTSVRNQNFKLQLHSTS